MVSFGWGSMRVLSDSVFRIFQALVFFFLQLG